MWPDHLTFMGGAREQGRSPVWYGSVVFLFFVSLFFFFFFFPDKKPTPAREPYAQMSHGQDISGRPRLGHKFI